jgi:hypothetical protein
MEIRVADASTGRERPSGSCRIPKLASARIVVT